jgi:YesN/AraC family two-component response regulator
VLSCSNGKEALDLIMHHMPDLVLSDIMMPEVNGITLLRKLKQL